MKKETQETFSLDVFEGPLVLLLQLLQKNEIEIWDVSIQRILNQYISTQYNQQSMESGAEFIGSTALLLLMKSKRLLPKHEMSEEEVEFLDANFEMINQILEYCRFKESARFLVEREQQQSGYYPRGLHHLETKKTLGIEHLTLSEIAGLFQQVLTKASGKKGVIQEEEWRVSDKMTFIRQRLNEYLSFPFENLFSADLSKGELIVTFLALLELMKGGELVVGKNAEQVVCIARTKNDE